MNCVKPLTTGQFIVWKEQTFPLSRIRLNLSKAKQSICNWIEKSWRIVLLSSFQIFCRIGKENAKIFVKPSSQLVFFPPKKVATSQAPHRIIDTLLFLIVIIRKAMKLSASVPKPILLKHNKYTNQNFFFLFPMSCTRFTHNSEWVSCFPIIFVWNWCWAE